MERCLARHTPTTSFWGTSCLPPSSRAERVDLGRHLPLALWEDAADPTFPSLPQAGGSTGLLMDLAANEKAVHADFFNGKDAGAGVPVSI